ncbi:succinyldiaminopimelate transaminase [Gammaproteobacteria bacterium ESL0073]|nr:succinyldiaminopimelate transaminase [Gammaproteobacteria bacterium ESL0073]
MNPLLEKLQPYPFEKLKALLSDVKPPATKTAISLSIGEPKHEAPNIVKQALIDHIDKLSVYPTTIGLLELRQAMASWVEKRFSVPQSWITPESHILPVNGTREALFSFTQAVVDNSKEALVISPNPFYQIYEGAALLSGAKPYYLACTQENNFIPYFDKVPADIWQKCQILFLCSPGNPTGSITPIETLKKLIKLADTYNFVIASDECYSELYFDESTPPAGLLTACAEMGRHDFDKCVVFHSLSKRSNLPGLRSGFVAGDAKILKKFLLYRTYHGCAMPEQTQYASIAAWHDEQHVVANRELYREKYDAVLSILSPVMDIKKPDGGFYLWPKTPIADTEFTKQLLIKQNVLVVPGSYLSREIDGLNPGENRVRMALVAPVKECIEAANRIKEFLTEYY